MIPGQPADAAIGAVDLHAMAVRGEIVEQRVMRDHNAVREARRAAGILEIGDCLAIGGRQGALGSVRRLLPPSACRALASNK